MENEPQIDRFILQLDIALKDFGRQQISLLKNTILKLLLNESLPNQDSKKPASTEIREIPKEMTTGPEELQSPDEKRKQRRERKKKPDLEELELKDYMHALGLPNIQSATQRLPIDKTNSYQNPGRGM